MHVDVVTGRRLHRRSRAPSWLREERSRKRKEEGERGRQAGLALVDASGVQTPLASQVKGHSRKIKEKEVEKKK